MLSGGDENSSTLNNRQSSQQDTEAALLCAEVYNSARLITTKPYYNEYFGPNMRKAIQEIVDAGVTRYQSTCTKLSIAQIREIHNSTVGAVEAMDELWYETDSNTEGSW